MPHTYHSLCISPCVRGALFCACARGDETPARCLGYMVMPATYSTQPSATRDFFDEAARGCFVGCFWRGITGLVIWLLGVDGESINQSNQSVNRFGRCMIRRGGHRIGSDYFYLNSVLVCRGTRTKNNGKRRKQSEVKLCWDSLFAVCSTVLMHTP